MTKTLITFVLNILSFIFIHNKFRFLSKYPPGWARITSHAVGIFTSFPFFVVYILHGERPEIAYMLTFLGGGAGTAFGWMLEDNID